MSDDDDFMMSDAESYEFEFEDDDDADDEDLNMEGGDGGDTNSSESLYYQAKNVKVDDFDKAKELFAQIGAIESEDDEQQLLEYKFKALKQTLKILYKLDKDKEFMDTLMQLFRLPLSRLQQNYVGDSLSKIADNYSNFDPPQQLQFYQTILDNYTKNDRLIIRTNLKKIQVLLDMKNLDEMWPILQFIHEKVEKLPEMTKSAYLLELYALEIQAHSESQDLTRLKELYKKTLSIQSTIPHPRINAVIKECGGKMHMRDENYEQASDELYESFKNYDEIGNQKKRIKILQYLIVASVLSNDEINKFESQETKYFLKDEDVLKFVQLLHTFEKLDHVEFSKLYEALCESEKDDTFMVQNLVKVEKTLKLRLLIHYIKPFKRLSLAKLSTTLKIPVDSIEDTFLSLRNTGQIPNVRLDLVDGIVFNE